MPERNHDALPFVTFHQFTANRHWPYTVCTEHCDKDMYWTVLDWAIHTGSVIMHTEKKPTWKPLKKNKIIIPFHIPFHIHTANSRDELLSELTRITEVLQCTVHVSPPRCRVPTEHPLIPPALYIYQPHPHPTDQLVYQIIPSHFDGRLSKENMCTQTNTRSPRGSAADSTKKDKHQQSELSGCQPHRQTSWSGNSLVHPHS